MCCGMLFIIVKSLLSLMTGINKVTVFLMHFNFFLTNFWMDIANKKWAHQLNIIANLTLSGSNLFTCDCWTVAYVAFNVFYLLCIDDFILYTATSL